MEPRTGGGVLAIAPAGSSVYLGGHFVSLGGTPAGGLGRVDATTGATQLFGPTGVNGPVWTIAVSGSTVYLAGQFTTVGGSTRHDAAAVNLLGVVQPWDPNIPIVGKVNSLAVGATSVYLAGSFGGPTSLNGNTERNYLAAVDPSSGAVTGWNPDATAPANALAFSGGSIGAGGTFTSLGPGVPRRNLAAFSAADGSLLPWAPEAPDGAVQAILPDGDRVFVGGRFQTIGGRVRPLLASIDAVTGIADGWLPLVGPPGGSVDTMQLVGQTLYIGGAFDQVNGTVTRNYAAALDVTTGFATPFDPNLNNPVTDLDVEGSTVYLAGQFTAVGGTSRNTAAAVDAGSGALLPWNPASDGSVLALAARGSTIYLGGQFSSVNGGAVSRSSAAAVDATSAGATGWDPALPSGVIVNALATSGSTVFLGTNTGVLRAADATTGARLGWNPVSSGGQVLALAADPAGGVVAGGSFTTLEESPQATVASFSAAPESIVAPSVSGAAVVGGTLACGEGTWAGSSPQSRAFAWLRDGAPIAGATAARYELTAGDGGRRLSCRVTSSNLGGSATATSAEVAVAPAAARPPAPTRPVISGLGIAPSSFRAAKRGGSIVPKHYARVSYRLSAWATVRFTAQRAATGRRRGKSCVKPAAKLRHAKKCQRYVPVRGSFARARPAGGDSFHFSGRLGGHALRPGAYRLVATATDRGGLVSQPATRPFHILAPKRHHAHRRS